MDLKKLFISVIVSIAGIAAIHGCTKTVEEKEEKKQSQTDTTLEAKRFLKSEYMDTYYYWNEEVKTKNDKLKASDYPDIYEYFDALLYKDDRWSWMCDRDYLVYVETGVVSGSWGVSLGQPIDYYDDYSLRVRYIIPGSPLEKYGVTRGAQLTAIGGYDMREPMTEQKVNHFNEQYALGSTTFSFRLADGRDTSFTASRSATLNTPSYLCAKIFSKDDFPALTEPVGYFNYLSFTSSKIKEIHSCLTGFHDAGLRKMILDLRYNGGGDTDALDTLLSFIAPEGSAGKVYSTLKHNRLLSRYGYNSSETIKSNTSNLGLEELYVITGEGSASCSEALINGLRPYMKVNMVGDTTYGKPNGMYLLIYPGEEEDYRRINNGDYSKVQWGFLPICFYDVNSEGEQIPDSGFVPDNLRADDLYHDFTADEDLIKACLNHIAGGTYPELSPSTKASAHKGTNGSFEDEKKPNYGILYKKFF